MGCLVIHHLGVPVAADSASGSPSSLHLRGRRFGLPRPGGDPHFRRRGARAHHPVLHGQPLALDGLDGLDLGLAYVPQGAQERHGRVGASSYACLTASQLPLLAASR
ncbi:hypothetical protein B0T25DRAFT_563318 [Lasiosphaeria hispida]|uniref:Uncharacterized protein n=1 Tax=Lasiosphaeria hispida TaxID=260671 RepID=A0AAJ0ML57_9PEZI|nr:hypothetical protein B0T25DRAFT_563318 [Lasiosphaeria hispida]